MYQVHTRLARFSSFVSVQAIVVLVFVVLIAALSQYIFSSLPKNVDSTTTESSFTPLPVDDLTPTTPAASVVTEPATPPTPPQPAPAPVAAVAPKPAPAVDTLSIPSIGFTSQYVSVGLTTDKKIDVDPKLVGWWNGSSAPGTAGASFMDGHISGIFSKLPGIRIGDNITVTKANGEAFTYTVVFRETVPLQDVDMKKALTVYGGASEGLNLMTCAGSYDSTLGTNNERLIVYAVRA